LQSVALQTASEYLNQVGTQIASVPLGCPPLDRNAATVAEFSNQMLQSAARCKGLLELTNRQRQL
jgi:hypothetical protein